jgi:uncharacterized protein YutE (UPF0331/DUF86 family)
VDTLTFISNIVESLAWPSALAAITIVLRKPLFDLIPLLRKLKYKELELEFSETLSHTKELQKNSGAEEPELEKKISRLIQLIEIAPRAAIVESWIDLERSIIKLAIRHGVSEEHATSKNSCALGKVLKSSNVISEKQYELFSTLRSLRNNAVHLDYFDISEMTAKEYVAQAGLLTINFDRQ